MEDIFGEYGYRDRSKRDQLPERRLYTLLAFRDIKNTGIRYQIYYILIDKRYRNGVKGVKPCPDADKIE